MDGSLCPASAEPSATPATGEKSAPKAAIKKKCPVCSTKFPLNWDKRLCQPCTDKIVKAEQPSLLDEIRSLVKQEVQSSLAAFTTPPPPPPPPHSPAKKRKIQAVESDSDSDLSHTSSVGWEDPVSPKAEVRKYLFSSDYIEDLVSAVRNTMGLEEEYEPQSVQDQMFGGLRSEKRVGFPVHANIVSMVNQEWGGKGKTGRWSYAKASHPWIVRFIRATQRLRPTIRQLTPPWDLNLVLRSLCKGSYALGENMPISIRTRKTTFLVAITTAKRVGEIQALCTRDSRLGRIV
ncbi:uncharacterized protein [Ranitomeya imitator]|uniref:uncharacterized protein n=1 Tax=Ranitomeya imitator TaxID=111125 RepID=UPI0037E936CE